MEILFGEQVECLRWLQQDGRLKSLRPWEKGLRVCQTLHWRCYLTSAKVVHGIRQASVKGEIYCAHNLHD